MSWRRGAISLERLTKDNHGDLVYPFTRPWSDGTTGITLSPLELVEKLTALMPLPSRLAFPRQSLEGLSEPSASALLHGLSRRRLCAPSNCEP